MRIIANIFIATILFSATFAAQSQSAEVLETALDLANDQLDEEGARIQKELAQIEDKLSRTKMLNTIIKKYIHKLEEINNKTAK